MDDSFQEFDSSIGDRNPSRHRMALLTMVGAYPTIVVLLSVLSPVLNDWPLPARAAVVVPLMVLTLTYVVMPVLTKAAGSWLHGSTRGAGKRDRLGSQSNYTRPGMIRKTRRFAELDGTDS